MKVGTTVNDAWTSYLDTMFKGVSVGEVQRDEMRKCFYAGAVTVMSVLNHIGDDPRIDEDQGPEILQSLQDEITAFVQSLTLDEWKEMK